MYTQLSIRKSIAKKEYKCELCSKPITIGSKYEREVGIFEGDFQSVKLHELCRKLCNEYNDDGESYYFTDVYEWAMETGKIK